MAAVVAVAVRFEILLELFLLINMDQTETKFIQQVKNNNFFNSQDCLLVAVSGGSDSMALLNLLLCLPHSLRGTIEVATVDFALRPQSSDEVNLVRQFCQQHQIPFHTTQWRHDDDLEAMEVKARHFRYNFFAHIMQQRHLNKLVTAHQSDDQVETILMKLIRSGNIWESKGILPQRSFTQGELIRPLLIFSKVELTNYLKRQHIKFAVDESNFQNITMRNRLRNQVLPLLRHENPQLNQHLAVFAAQNQTLQQIVLNYFQQLATMAVQAKSNGWQIDLVTLKQLQPPEVALFVQFVVHQKLSFDLNNRQLQQVQFLLQRSQAHLDLKAGWTIDKSYQKLIIQPVKINNSAPDLINLPLDKPVFANGQQKITIKQVTKKNSRTFYFDKIPQNIILRRRQAGDNLRLLNGQHQKLKKRLIDLKIPQIQRDQLKILVFDDQIVWIPGIYRYQCKPTPYLFEVIIGD